MLQCLLRPDGFCKLLGTNYSASLAERTWRFPLLKLIFRVVSVFLRAEMLEVFVSGPVFLEVETSFCPQDSMLFSARKVSSACTGALTSDMALSVIERTINDSERCQATVMFDLKTVHVTLAQECSQIMNLS